MNTKSFDHLIYSFILSGHVNIRSSALLETDAVDIDCIQSRAWTARYTADSRE